MSRYIDAEWLRNLYADFKDYDGRDDWTTPIANVLATIYDAPSIDLADYVPKDFHDKTCEAMAKAHQEEIADILERADADRPQEWIPCSERLPSEYDEFLITWTASVTNGSLLAFAEYEPDDLLVSGGKWYLEDDMREFKDVDVIAWMPLPEPWKGADDE